MKIIPGSHKKSFFALNGLYKRVLWRLNQLKWLIMIKISVLTGHLFFKWSKSYVSNIPEADLLHRIVALEKQKKCIEGKINRQDFDVFYLSAGASLTSAPLPLIATVFFFFFLKILFISESDSCDRFFRLVAEA